jgi:general secretion pathway protein D
VGPANSGGDVGGAVSGSTGGGGSDGLSLEGDALGWRRAIVTADVNTNSIIVVAGPQLQSVYERLIRMLDRRRPQVLIEITIATINTTDDFSLGVELSRNTSADGGKVLTFSSFGLSTVNAATGGLTLIPGAGFNGAVIDSEVADIVIKALKKDTRTKVVSTPRILVNDNATGTLTSIAEEPYTTISQGQVTDTTSFGGFVEAGTTITVVPHISEGDYLSLEYAISLNSFRDADTAAGIPPPRQTDSVESEVTVPDGHTIIIGGLTRQNLTETVNAVPILGEIPLLKYLFSSQSIERSHSTLFVFLRPVILRDDEFEDIKFMSSRQMGLADMPADLPSSEPLTVE